MGFKMNGSPAKMGTISGTAGHSSALKMRESESAASALKQMEVKRKDAGVTKEDKGSVTFNATGTEFNTGGANGKNVKVNKDSKVHKKLTEQRWKQGDKASGGTLNELTAARKKHKKGSAEYAAIQNKINKSLGSKKVHKATDAKGEPIKPKGTTTRKSDGATVKKGLGAQKGKTLTFTEKAAEKVKIEKANVQIQEGKTSGDKNIRDEGQLKKGEIKSGKDNAKTGTVVSRYLARRKVKRNKRQLENRKKKEENA
jgi:hypothetical protein